MKGMSKQMTLSFVVVARNAEKTLDNLFEDLERQTYPHERIEIILVDSASSDQTREIMDRFAREHRSFHEIKVLENQKRTLPCGWNIALTHATGEVILRVDAHTRIPEDFIEKNMALQGEGEKICGGKVVSILQEDSDWQQMLMSTDNTAFCGGAADFRRKEGRQEVSTLAFAAYHREVFAAVGGYDERLARTEDNEMHYRMKQAGYRFMMDSEIVSYRYARSTLGRMLRQKYLNGYWIGLTMGVCPKCFSVYHFVPFVFFLSVVCTIVLALCGFSLPLVLLAVLYGAADLFFSIKSIVEFKGKWSFYLLPVVFFLIHLCYGAGTFVGLLRMPFKIWKKGKDAKQRIESVRCALQYDALVIANENFSGGILAKDN